MKEIRMEIEGIDDLDSSQQLEHDTSLEQTDLLDPGSLQTEDTMSMRDTEIRIEDFDRQYKVITGVTITPHRWLTITPHKWLPITPITPLIERAIDLYDTHHPQISASKSPFFLSKKRIFYTKK